MEKQLQWFGGFKLMEMNENQRLFFQADWKSQPCIGLGALQSGFPKSPGNFVGAPNSTYFGVNQKKQ